MSEPANGPGCRLYLITPDRVEAGAFGDGLAAALDAGDVACVQLRLTDASDDEVRGACRSLMPICHEREVAFIVNDRPDLAAELGADGAHVGADDPSAEAARQVIGEDAILGVSCYGSRERAIIAAEQGADYVAFGAFFATTTKTPRARPEPDILQWWHETTTVPSVAIGGITVENCTPLVEAGADFLAVMSGVWRYPEGPAAAVRDLNEAIAGA